MIISFRNSIHDQALKEACELWECTPETILEKNRTTEVHTVRSCLGVAMRNVLGITTTRIGKTLNRTHKNVLYWCQNHSLRMSTMHKGTDKRRDPLYYENYNAIAERLKKL